ncbi:GNAT family N-acetyltransferase [Pseudoalteromonas byunsanensis]|uniref:GNAT family N-acetyltransferase n=1 Tax=Pseudoalteromonas byunsanensis TaxID=327939 RepID=A0A1S1N9J4_9GAMM|nr:GNAT family N-acetyltransferase [Pseudoalteromonas byunsanensis]OHU94940.1 GNAT family N-acetyltransferase [Pseudoalteromonas byunsanensis]
MELSFTNQAPNVDEFMLLRAKIGWKNPESTMVKKSLDNSIFHVCVYVESQLVGYGRIVGDGAMYFYLQDIIIDPDYQSHGIGKAVMQKIELFLADNAVSGATIALLAAYGKEEFYAKFGYSSRTGRPLGLGMCKFVA